MNDSSAVVWLGYAGTGALFCGDISSEVEKRLIGEYELGFSTAMEWRWKIRKF